MSTLSLSPSPLFCLALRDEKCVHNLSVYNTAHIHLSLTSTIHALSPPIHLVYMSVLKDSSVLSPCLSYYTRFGTGDFFPEIMFIRIYATWLSSVRQLERRSPCAPVRSSRGFVVRIHICDSPRYCFHMRLGTGYAPPEIMLIVI